jgi:HlyD family secretion protein
MVGAAVATLAGLAVVGYFGWRHLYPPETGLKLYGNVDIRQVDLAFRVGGRIIAIPYEEGARVAAGARLAQIDPLPLRHRLASAAAKVAAADAALAKLKNGNRAQDIASAKAELASRNATLLNARLDFARRSALVGDGTVTRAVYDQSEATFRAAEASVNAAAEALSLQQAGSRLEDIEAGMAALATSIADRDTAQTDLDDTALLAPEAGVLLTRAREPGAMVAAGDTVFTLTIETPRRVRAYVGEIDLDRIQPGMNVTLTTDGKQHFRGTIGFISPTAEFTPKTVETTSLRADLVYRLRIIVADPDHALRQGQPVTVLITDPAAARAPE